MPSDGVAGDGAATPSWPPPPWRGAPAPEQANHPPVPFGEHRRTHPLSAVLPLGGLIVSAPIVFLALTAGALEEVVQFVIALVASLFGAVAWLRRTWALTPDAIELDHGVIGRTHRVVPYRRIQQVDVHQELIPRMLGLAQLRIETAGEGGGDAVQLKYVERSLAEAVRAYVLAQRAGPVAGWAPPGAPGQVGEDAAPTVAPAGPPSVLLRLSPTQLVAAGLTSSSAVPLALVLLPWVLGALVVAVNDPGGAGDALVGLPVAALVAAGLLGLVVLEAWTTLSSGWDLTLSSRGDDLHLRAGLFTVQEQTFPRHRVQQVSVVDNPLRRMAGLTGVVLHTAAQPGSKGAGAPVSIPAVRRDALGPLIHAALGPEWAIPPLAARPPAALRRAVLRRVAVVVLLALPPTVLWWPLGAAALLATPLGLWWGQEAHRRAGWGMSPTVAALAKGVVHHRIELVPRARVQSARATASPFQRRVDLATLHLDVAGASRANLLAGAPELYDLGAADVATGVRSVATLPAPRPAGGDPAGRVGPWPSS